MHHRFGGTLIFTFKKYCIKILTYLELGFFGTPFKYIKKRGIVHFQMILIFIPPQ